MNGSARCQKVGLKWPSQLPIGKFNSFKSEVLTSAKCVKKLSGPGHALMHFFKATFWRNWVQHHICKSLSDAGAKHEQTHYIITMFCVENLYLGVNLCIIQPLTTHCTISGILKLFIWGKEVTNCCFKSFFIFHISTQSFCQITATKWLWCIFHSSPISLLKYLLFLSHRVRAETDNSHSR